MISRVSKSANFCPLSCFSREASSSRARESWAEDSFFPELIYHELLVTRYQGKRQESLALCEELMLGYPDYRMMWAVENFYEESLQNIESGADG